MSELEKNIINLLPTLSEEAKKQACLVLGVHPVKKKTKKGLTIEEHRVLIRKAFKI